MAGSRVPPFVLVGAGLLVLGAWVLLRRPAVAAPDTSKWATVPAPAAQSYAAQYEAERLARDRLQAEEDCGGLPWLQRVQCLGDFWAYAP